MIVGGDDAAPRVVRAVDLPGFFRPRDVVVVNDAATLPASLVGRTAHDEPVEARLVAHLGQATFLVALFGAGDFRTRTEDRPPPPPSTPGERIHFGTFTATIGDRHALSPRLVQLHVEGDRPWAKIYEAGRPIQYAHVEAPLDLWDVQNPWAAEPWAVEMPSAGRVFDVGALLALRARGVAVTSITHAAGISSVGDAAVDAALPLPERYRVPPAAAAAVREARANGGRVIAVGTSVVRALESAARGPSEGVTDLVIGGGFELRMVDGVVSGVHDDGTSHRALLGAFADEATLAELSACARRAGLLGHELGDACLVFRRPRAQGNAPRTNAGVC